MNRAERRRAERSHRIAGPCVAIVEPGRTRVHVPTDEQLARQRQLSLDAGMPPTRRLLRAAFPAILDAVDAHLSRGGDLSSAVVLVGNRRSDLSQLRECGTILAKADVVVCVAERSDPPIAEMLDSMPLRIDGPTVVGAEAVSIIVATDERMTSFVNVFVRRPTLNVQVN